MVLVLVSINKVGCANSVGASGVSDIYVNVLLIRLLTLPGVHVGGGGHDLS